MDARALELDIFTITAGARTVGLESAEIRHVITGSRALEQGSAFLSEARAAGRFFTLNRLLCRAEEPEIGSVLVIRSLDGTDRLLGFSGVMDVTRIRVADVLPVSTYLRRQQRPFVVWGFLGRGEGALMLITFQYLQQEGAR
jgi:hypothetical protein